MIFESGKLYVISIIDGTCAHRCDNALAARWQGSGRRALKCGAQHEGGDRPINKSGSASSNTSDVLLTICGFVCVHS